MQGGWNHPKFRLLDDLVTQGLQSDLDFVLIGLGQILPLDQESEAIRVLAEIVSGSRGDTLVFLVRVHDNSFFLHSRCVLACGIAAIGLDADCSEEFPRICI